MYVTLVSACEKRAIKRTRAVMDSFALRTGPNTWFTAITEEGLRELRAALKRVATRQTAVACYRNAGRRRMQLLWVVGSRRKFGAAGHFPAGYMTGARRPRPVADWVRLTALLAQTAGLAHDWGKAMRLFQDKLHGPRNQPPQKDPVRHEWVSLKLLSAMRGESETDAVWEGLARSFPRRMGSPDWQGPEWFSGLRGWADALEFLVASHHKLFEEGGINLLGCGNHLRGEKEANVRQVAPAAVLPAASLPDKICRKVEANCGRLARLEAADNPDPEFWRAIATIARVCLVLADQFVSARPRAADDTADGALFANTDKQGERCQSLDWHLREVGRAAGDLVYRLAGSQMPGLSEEGIERVLRPAGDERFVWQDLAAGALSKSAEAQSLPTLVLNLAGTGAGKTRMNAKALCALRPEGPVRFATALNLRTLTLQTGDAYRKEIGIGGDEMACVIGDRVVQKLHAHKEGYADAGGWRDYEDEDGNDLLDFELETVGEAFDLPEWLEPLAAQRPGSDRVLGPPILVSTVDTLIKAGEPQYQGHHAIQFLRLTGSDLVLDELDGYDPEALVAVLRLVTVAGLFGRHVVASSATLPLPVVRALTQAFALGVRMHAALEGAQRNRFRCAYIDNRVAPALMEYAAEDPGLVAAVERDFGVQTRALFEVLADAGLKVPELQPVEGAGGAALFDAAVKAAWRLHRGNRWALGDSGHRVSFGLVRCANIRTAIPMARALAEQLPQARVACYHSQDLLIQRYHKECRLDFLLNRKAGDEHIALDDEILSTARAASGEDLLFIVVATPVEEVGRDHDFDWAVIEPSSTHSIVQTAGRVNRHRCKPQAVPNIAILQFNALQLRGGDGQGRAFVRPGLELADARHPSHDLAELLDWESLREVDARMRYSDRHAFAVADDQALGFELSHRSGPFARFLRTDDGLWMGVKTYSDARLRTRGTEISLRVSETGAVFREEAGRRRSDCSQWVSMALDERAIRARVENDWLTRSLGELADLAREAEISLERALAVTLPDYSHAEMPLADSLKWDLSFGWLRR